MSLRWKAGLAGILVLSAVNYAAAQMTTDHAAMLGQPGVVGQPTSPGQDAFGAIQEIVRILDADPTTDWSKVDIGALRQHLIDMNEVALHAARPTSDPSPTASILPSPATGAR